MVAAAEGTLKLVPALVLALVVERGGAGVSASRVSAVADTQARVVGTLVQEVGTPAEVGTPQSAAVQLLGVRLAGWWVALARGWVL